MAYDTNICILVGRLTRDPEISYTKSGTSIAKFSIAVNSGKEQVSFFDITAWEKLANTCQQYLNKGKQVIVTGRLSQSRFTDKNGQNRSKIEIVANNVQFIGGDGSNNTSQGAQSHVQQRTQQNTGNVPQSDEWGDIGANEPYNGVNPIDPF